LHCKPIDRRLLACVALAPRADPSGGADREIATAITALDAVSLALAGAAMTALEREATDLFERAGDEADRG
jgi:hypothetical protein